MYWHFVRELLCKIEWPSIRRINIGISCTYWNFVHALPYSVIKSTQSPWDSGSRIDKKDLLHAKRWGVYNLEKEMSSNQLTIVLVMSEVEEDIEVREVEMIPEVHE